MAALGQLNTSVSECYLSDVVGAFEVPDVLNSGSQWTRGLRGASVTARLLGSQVRIPRGHKCVYLAIIVCCQVQVSSTGRFLVHGTPSECVFIECDLMQQ
jgi:hypothetical protein